jgi:broad specificity phosphatase PhoE
MPYDAPPLLCARVQRISDLGCSTMKIGLTRVYLARHGQTALNAEGRLRGLSDPPLDAVGEAEAKRLAAVLALKEPTVVLTSPLQRAVSTGRAIADAAGVEVVVDQRLNDRDYGPLTGERRSEVEARYGSVDSAPGVEPLSALTRRAESAFFALAAEWGPGPVVMVSHDAFNGALLGVIDPSLAGAPQRTACWNQLSLVDDLWRVDSYDQKPTV